MIILTKKRIYIALAFIVFSTFIGISGIGMHNETKTVATVALPASSKVIVIDAGHGVPDERC